MSPFTRKHDKPTRAASAGRRSWYYLICHSGARFSDKRRAHAPREVYFETLVQASLRVARMASGGLPAIVSAVFLADVPIGSLGRGRRDRLLHHRGMAGQRTCRRGGSTNKAGPIFVSVVHTDVHLCALLAGPRLEGTLPDALLMGVFDGAPGRI